LFIDPGCAGNANNALGNRAVAHGQNLLNHAADAKAAQRARGQQLEGGARSILVTGLRVFVTRILFMAGGVF